MTAHNTRDIANILVVDDSPENLRIFTSILHEAGHKVRPVPNGRLALQALRHSPPDLVLLDIAMPEPDGFEVCRRLKADRRTADIPVIFITALTDTADQIMGFEVGGVDYITKPVHPEVLTVRVGTQLELRRARYLLQHQAEILDEQVRQQTAELAKANRELTVEIAERKRIEETLRQLHKAVETMQMGVTIADLNGNILYTNPAEAGMHGYRVEEMLGRDVRTLAPPELRKPLTLRQIGDRPGLVRESVNLRKDGSTFPVWLMSEVVRNADGQPSAIVTSCEDITDRKAAEAALQAAHDNLEAQVTERTEKLRRSMRQLEETNRQLELANQAKSRFLSSMSHELRTPLNSILGFFDLLRGQFFGPLNEKQQHFVAQIGHSGKHLLSLINDLLDMAKIDAGAMPIHLGDVELQHCIRDAVIMMSAQFAQKQMALETDIEPELPPITADERKYKQILLNLLSNALKFTPEQGRVMVRIWRESEMLIRTEVSDSGAGIEIDEQSKVFSEFYQAERVRDEELEGTGIGLALTRRLVELHGGRIGVRSQPGQGSTFWFTMPILGPEGE